MTHLVGWRLTTLGEECEIVSGSTPKTGERAFWDGDIPWLTPADLSKWKGTYIDGGSRYITKEGLDSCSARLFPRNTVMMSSRAPIGYTAIANREMCTNQGFKSMLPSETVDPEWLRYFLEHALPEIKSMSSGTTFAEISGKKLATLPMSLPPLAEQRRIVETLDDHLSRLDNALAEIQAADLGLTNLKHASLDSLFMGDSEPFPKVTLGSLGKWVTGSTPKTSNPLYQGEDVPFVTPGDIFYGGEILSVRRRISNIGADAVRRLPAPSVQVVCIGATLGKVGYSLEEVTTNQQITSLLPDDKVITAGYAAWLLSSPLVQSLLWKSSSSTTVPILNKGSLEQIEVPLAPLQKQSEILAQIDTQTELSSSLSERTTLARGNVSSLRRSILNRAFSGKLLEGKV